jgi:integrase
MISALKLFYKIIGQPKKMRNIKCPRREYHLPKILPPQYVLNKINSIENLKHKAILKLGINLGLRVSEVINLKIVDIDSPNACIHIVSGKGNRDRNLPLCDGLLKLLRDYYRVFKPIEYLFNGQKSNQYSVTSCEAIYHKYVDKVTAFHTLRHVCFTNLVNQNESMGRIQSLAGHKNITTTQRYLHITHEHLRNLPLLN